MSVFKTQEVRDVVRSKWDSFDFVDVVHQGFGGNAPINKFILCYEGNYYSVGVESWFYDDDSGDVVDFEDVVDDFVKVKRVEKVVIDWEED